MGFKLVTSRYLFGSGQGSLRPVLIYSHCVQMTTKYFMNEYMPVCKKKICVCIKGINVHVWISCAIQKDLFI